jgi:WD40 repeat protein
MARLWDVETGKEQATLKGHEAFVFCVAFTPDGKTVATGSYDETVKLWDAATGNERATLRGHQGGIASVAFSPDGKLLATGNAKTRFTDLGGMPRKNRMRPR